MKKIDWNDSKKKSEAYQKLMEIFGVSKPTVSLAMNFKRNTSNAIKMRYMAISELGGIQLSDDQESVRTSKVKILDSKGNVIKCVEDSIVTL